MNTELHVLSLSYKMHIHISYLQYKSVEFIIVKSSLSILIVKPYMSVEFIIVKSLLSILIVKQYMR